MAGEHDLRRHFDAGPLNALANHPAIRPTCGGDGKSQLDLSAFVADHKNHAVLWKYGFFMFQWSAPNTYCVDMAVLPEGRGRSAYAMALAGIAYIVAQGAEMLWARIAQEYRALRHYAAAAGFTKCGEDALDIGFGPVCYDLYHWKKPCLQRS